MLISVSAHVSPPPPGFGFVGLQGINIQRKATREEDNMKVVKIEIMQIYNESNFQDSSKLYLANADCKGGRGSFDFRLLKGRSRSFTGEVKEFRSTNTFRYSVQSRFGDLVSPF